MPAARDHMGARCLGAAYARDRRVRLAVATLAAIALGGVYFTFARGAWLALLCRSTLIFVLLPSRRRQIAIRWLVLLLAVAAAGVFAFNSFSSHRVSDPLTAGLKRIESVGSYRNDVSSRYRFAEWSEAVHEIKRHPLFGIGLGNSISFTNPMFSPTNNHYGYAFSTFYIHNSYIWVMLKLGLVAALVFSRLSGESFGQPSPATADSPTLAREWCYWLPSHHSSRSLSSPSLAHI